MAEGTQVVTFFLLQRLLQCLTTAEYSIFPAASLVIRDELHLSEVELGLIGTVTYAGIVCGSLVASSLFASCGTQKVLRVCMLVSSAMTLATVAAPSASLLLTARFVAGFSHAALYAYFPVWIDHFAPAGQEAKWMGLYCLCGAVGNLASYAATAYLVYFLEWSWRWSFMMTGCSVLAMALGFGFVPGELWPVGIPQGLGRSGLFLEYPCFWCFALVFPIQWYGIAGLEYFGLEYGHYLGASAQQASSYYVMAGGGVALGVVAGSTFADLIGGYGDRKRALTFCLTMACLPVPFFGRLGHPSSVGACFALAGGVLACFAAITPVLTGLALRSVPKARATEASAVLQLLNTAFGFMLGPGICGVIAEKHGLPACWQAIFSPAQAIAPLLGLAFLFDRGHKGGDVRDDAEDALVERRASV